MGSASKRIMEPCVTSAHHSDPGVYHPIIRQTVRLLRSMRQGSNVYCGTHPSRASRVILARLTPQLPLATVQCHHPPMEPPQKGGLVMHRKRELWQSVDSGSLESCRTSACMRGRGSHWDSSLATTSPYRKPKRILGIAVASQNAWT